jgi:hypothetical protein
MPASKKNQFVRTYQRAIYLTEKGERVQVVSDGDYVDRQGLRKLFIQGLHHKINSLGKIKEEYRESQVDLWIDGQILTAWKQRRQKTQYGLKFRTRYFKKRFFVVELQLYGRFSECSEPIVQAAAKLKDLDPYGIYQNMSEIQAQALNRKNKAIWESVKELKIIVTGIY